MAEPQRKQDDDKGIDPQIDTAKHRMELSREAVGGRGKGEKDLNRDTPMAGVGQNTGSREKTPGASVAEREANDDEKPPTPPHAQRIDRKSMI